MKLKRGMSINEDGELEENIGKPLEYYAFTIIIASILFFVGFAVGGFFVNGIYDHNTSPSVRNIISGCAAAYDFQNTKAARTDMFNSYYSSNSVTDTMIDCLKRSSVISYNDQTGEILPMTTVRTALMGCMGADVSNNWFNNKDMQATFNNCLSNNRMFFKIVPSSIVITMTPPS